MEGALAATTQQMNPDQWPELPKVLAWNLAWEDRESLINKEHLRM
ncbi:hypothetical protein [Anaerospora hongkongensis]